ncbi:hypothetical protein QAD02_006815 [Eretmocerus hayati]|uniref:Uncharacterized protein n=1 Tax=Eretmocerus hayati TaxID=131215 RepID=A0ACC2N203_9HYME|nr:hypothetical protein QAD02_006815 [Eretmocerus hayati]
MSKNTCCVVNCTNDGRDSRHLFFSFPMSKSKSDQIALLIAAMKRKNADGSPWVPKPHHRICSAHFIGNDKSSDERSPSYVATIPPPPLIYKVEKIDKKSVSARYQRLLNRHNKHSIEDASTLEESLVNRIDSNPEDQVLQNVRDHNPVDIICDPIERVTVDKDCQIESFDSNEHHMSSNTFFICKSEKRSHSHVEIQTDVILNTREILGTKKKQMKMYSKKCGAAQKVMSD